MRLFNKIPFIKDTVLAGNDNGISIGSNSWTDDWSHKGLKKNSSFFLFSFYFLEKRWFKHCYSGFIINHDEIFALEWLFHFQLFIRHSTLFWVIVFLNIREWHGMDRAKINVFEPSLDSVLIIIESYWAIRRANDQEPIFYFEDTDGSWNHVFLHLVYFIWVVHQVYGFYCSSFFRLGVIFHDERYVPHYYQSLFCPWYRLRRVGDKDGLSQCFFCWNFRRIEFKTSFATFPKPEENSGLSGCGKLVLVMVEFDKLLHAVNFLVHFGGDVAWLLLLPFPKCDPLLSGSGGLAEGGDQGSLIIDIEGDNSVWMRVEDGLAGSTGIDIPNHKHGVLASVSRDNDVPIFVVGCRWNLVTLHKQKGTWPCNCLWRLFS